ncbi:hypothetical protein NLK61_09920 [Pseudomonas fuscovaginae UPB0736]|uniref:hypothetical protein n=1 Tax=Pseudomonas asplenii TaxID=53407 RepID=UPI000288E5EC|nr:hypothetical protein [Pseudomonas fuscovaginae]UUQ66932.1 hypothetical protein NLK61_09920 [Pseudomonas fuscovaginae UPB0736]
MTNFRPLESNLTETPVIYLRLDAPIRDLHEFAAQRIKAARDLAHSLTCMSIGNTCDRDLYHFAGAAYLLLQDGCDALDALQNRLTA